MYCLSNYFIRFVKCTVICLISQITKPLSYLYCEFPVVMCIQFYTDMFARHWEGKSHGHAALNSQLFGTMLKKYFFYRIMYMYVWYEQFNQRNIIPFININFQYGVLLQRMVCPFFYFTTLKGKITPVQVFEIIW